MIYSVVLKNYFEGKKLIFNGDCKEIINKFNDQSLAPYLYYVYGKQFFNIYLASVKVQERFFKIEEELNNIFDIYAVPHFYIKGTVLSKLYPDSALRTRGDIDVIIREEDIYKVDKILNDHGYIFESECFHHRGYKKNNLEIEVHTKLLSSDFKIRDLFSNPFSNTIKISNSLYKLDDTYHYLFCLFHFNKHLKVAEGIRYILDFYYMQKSFNIDYELLDELINKYKLNVLHKNIINSIYTITNEKLHGYTSEDSLFFIEYLERSGIHGKTTDVLSVDVNKSKSKMYYLLDRVFLFDKLNRSNLYPKLSKHRIYYPLIVIHRSFRLLFTKLSMAIKVLKVKKVSNDKVLAVYEKLGVVEL